ncbi:MAG TPA: T9SS type A sorting domain-containing protein, partial [Saprospiraceae bacterium]|nr:T9SS type A sorting domain-containing protein [Saprospiraceae bacterium]
IVQGECPNEFIIFRTWTATDECGNSATCAQTVTIVDTTPPEISCPADLTWECDESIDPASTGTATASDNCDSAPSTSYGDITDPGSCLTITRIWTATDACGNSSTCAQIITVVDNTPPNIVCPPDATVECDEGTDPADTGSAAAADFCDPTPSIDYTDVVGPGICHTITRTWTATDACGNSSSCVQIISVEDNTPPTIFCPPDVTLVGGESTDPADTGTATASDNCDATPDITYSDNYIPGPCSMEFSISRTWTATDACGNTAQCTQTLDRDDEPPIPVCLASVVVSLNVMGMTVIPAEAFDGGSTDNCGTVYFKVKRMTPPDGFDCFYDGNSLYQFDDYIKFCCEDVGNENLMVILRVYDVLPVPGIVPDDYLVGHFADCMLEVEVQDKIPPQIICPSDLTISCVFDYDPDDLSVFGDVVTTPADREDICLDDPGNPYTDGITCVGIDGIAIDNCSVSVTDTAIFDIHSACGTGHILRIFTATDPGGLSVSCEQWITIINYTPFDESNISWPPDYTTMDICQVDLLDPEDLPAPHDFPVLEEDECELVTFTYQDLVFDFSNSQQACFKILRTWTVLDWCQYQVGGGEGIWTRTQVIKVVNTVGPEITLEEEVVVCTDDPGCGPGHVQLEVSAIDDCSGPEALRWTVGVDENNNGSLEQLYTPLFGENVLLNIQLPLGVHRILYSVEDFCGNVTTEEQYITMESCKPPSAKCLDLTTTLMPVDTDGDQQADWGMVTLWASDFDAGSDHACGNPVQVAFSSDPGDVSRVFDCEDLGVSLVELWVIDDNGNTDFCIVTLTIQDNFDVCPETNQQQAIVTGTISTSLSEHVPGVSVNLVGSNLPPTLTNDNGEYAFPPMPFGGAYRVEPILDTNHKKGISTLDLILLQKHLLGIQALDSPYKIIAGDANHSETLSAMDIVVLRRLILGITQVIPNNTSWRFVDALYQFSDPLNPLLEAFPETYEIGSLDGDMDVDFIAIKVGDMNGSAMSSILANSIETRQAPGMIDMLLQDQHLRSGETTTVEILCHRIGEIQGMQFTLEWNPQYMDITPIPGSALLTDAHWNIEHLHQGMLPVSWTRYDVDQNGNTTALLTLNVFAKKEISLSHVELRISEAVTPIEGLLEDGRMAVPKLVIHSWHTETELLMYQNQPNPFTHKTIIPVLLPEAMPLKLEVFSPDGKMVHREEINGNSGYNTFLLDAMMLQGQGVYTYTISTDTEYRTLRMIVVGE